MTVFTKELLGLTAIILTISALIPYIVSIIRGNTKPHIFSWIIWGTTTLIVFVAQAANKGGAGAWPTGFSGAMTFYIAWLAYNKQSDSSITRADWCFFIAAIGAIPCWYYTSNALFAVILLTFIDILGYAPTLRKAYYAPFEEQNLLYILMCFRNVFAILALEHYSLTTTLFPLATTLANIVTISLIFSRQRYVKALERERV